MVREFTQRDVENLHPIAWKLIGVESQIMRGGGFSPMTKSDHKKAITAAKKGNFVKCWALLQRNWCTDTKYIYGDIINSIEELLTEEQLSMGKDMLHGRVKI